jgi:hypothetical protein
MALNSSGQLSLGGATTGESVNLELGKSATALVSFNDTDLRTLFGVASGQISMSTGYGKSSYSAAGTHGYAFGGSGFSAPPATTGVEITGLRFSDEAFLDPAAAIDVIYINSAGAGNTTAKAYISTGDRQFTFSNETFANSPVSPSGVTPAPFSYANSTTHMYGRAGSTGRYEKFNFSTQTWQNLGVISNYPTAQVVQAVQNPTKAFWSQGFTPAYVPQYQPFVEGITFSNDSIINPGAVLAQGRTANSAVNSATRGYFAGGQISPWPQYSEIDGIDFSTNTGVNPGAGLVQGRAAMGGINSATRGYFMGGQNGPVELTQIDGIQFNTETAIDPAASMKYQTGSAAGAQNSNN